jgi:4-hydroxy-tetrahydrodipicolinate synthase
MKQKGFCELKGIVPPLVTPMLADGTLDIEGLHNVIDHVIAHRISGIFILGTTGEAPSLSRSLRQEMVSETCRWVDGRVPVLAGITDTSLVESADLARLAADAGVTAAVASAPYYFPIGQKELSEYIQKLAGVIPLPMYVYNMPNCTKTVFELDTLKYLTAIPNIIGVKDSSGDMTYFKQLLELKAIRQDWSILIGPEELLAEAVLYGADGGVTGGANLFPQLYIELYEAAQRNDLLSIRPLQDAVKRICDCIYNPSYLPGLKYALACKKLCSEVLADPLHPASVHQKEAIERLLCQLDRAAFPWLQEQALPQTILSIPPGKASRLFNGRKSALGY